VKFHVFKAFVLSSIAAAALLFPAVAQSVSSLNDLNYWGSGSNHAGVVIAWNDGKQDATLAFGFSWNGTATLWDAVTTLAHNDPRLFFRVDSASSNGPAVYGIGFDANNNGVFSVTGAEDAAGNSTTVSFVNGISDMNTDSIKSDRPASSVDATSGESADHYVEGWLDNGYWQVLTGGTGSPYPTTWNDAGAGAGSVTLTNNSWYSFAITDSSYNSQPPGSALSGVVAVPEPSTFVLLGLGGVVGFALRRRRA
jgi:hypothetical protein